MKPALPIGSVRATGLGVVVAVVCLRAASAGGGAGAASWFAALLLAVVSALVAWRRGRIARPLWLAPMIAALALGLWAGRPVLDAPDSARWRETRQRELAPSLEAVRAAVADVRAGVEAMPARTVGWSESDPDLDGLRTDWSRTVDPDGFFPLALALWRGGERVSWSGELEPFPVEDLPDGEGAAEVRTGRRGPVWRGGSPTAAGLLEWQVGLHGDGPVAWGGPTRDGVSLHVAVVQTPEPRPTRWQGDAERGLRATTDVVLDPVPDDMELSALRVTLTSPPRAADEARLRQRRQVVVAATTGAAFVCWVLATGWGWWALGAAWIVRAIWAATDLMHAVPAVGGRDGGMSSPADPRSLLEPTYFATSWFEGFFASTVDAVLTALLVAATAVGAYRFLRRGSEERIFGDGPRWAPALLGLAAGAVAAWVWHLAVEVAVNAHPRLIGPSIPVRAVTFWGLHFTLFLVAGSVLTTGALAMRRWGRGGTAAAVLLTVGALVGSLVGASFSSSSSSWMHAAAPAIALLVWGTALQGRVRRVAARWLMLGVPLFLATGWNYLALAHAYRSVENGWLERKLEGATASREEWVEFLMEDLLAEMSSDEAVLQTAPGAHAPEADGLWRDWPAYALWRATGLEQLGLPCQVELLNADHEAVSRFASGLFRDQGYEIVSRSDWMQGNSVTPRPGESRPLFLQTERRRYATGDEWLLRGEIQRFGVDGGWLALELPVRTGRLRTVRSALAPTLDWDDGGYAPRQDVDRPVLLLREGPHGWESDGGNAGDGEPAASFSVPESGREAPFRASWAGRTWRCLWQPEQEEGRSVVLGVQEPSAGDLLLDFSRLLLIDLLMAAGLLLAPVTVRALRLRLRGEGLGLQERFLIVSVLLGLMPLVVAGLFIDRSNRAWLTEDARERTREGLETAREQLQGLLAEQARALAASDYINDLLGSRLTGSRPLGPFAMRQATVFSADGELLLDETLSDLDDDEARLLLDQARASSLVVIRDEDGLYLGTVIPVDLETPTDVSEVEGLVGSMPGPGTRRRAGFFFYRQRLDGDLLLGLSEVIRGHATLYLEGEAVLASDPDLVFADPARLILPPEQMRAVEARPGYLHLVSDERAELAWNGLLRLPVLHNRPDDGVFELGETPGILAASFPARGREFAAQRERTVMFLAGLATLVFLTATLLALGITWRIFDPVRVLVTATRRLATGDYDAPLPSASRDELGTLGAAFGAMRDDLRQAQTDLQERERFLARLLERVPVGVAVFTDEDAVVTLNPAARAMIRAFFGDDRDEDDARRLLEGFRGDATARETVDGGVQAELVSDDGERTLRGRLAPLVLGDGRRDRMIVFEDVSEFLETKRLAINAQLARQVAHEVKNPLTPIQLSVQFLEQAWRDGAENLDEIVRSTVAQVLEQVALLRSIVTEFSLLGRPEDLACGPVDLGEVVDGVLGRYRRPDGDDAWLRETGDRPPPVSAHAESLAKVVANLMENSLQAVGDPRELELELVWRVDEREVALHWRDNGPGLDPDVADRLFDLYFSTKTHGTGLGLPICRNLLSRMGGRIRIGNREDGGGAEAVVTLPRANPDTETTT